MYWGDVAEMIQPLLLIGMKTPMSIRASPSPGRSRRVWAAIRHVPPRGGQASGSKYRAILPEVLIAKRNDPAGVGRRARRADGSRGVRNRGCFGQAWAARRRG